MKKEKIIAAVMVCAMIAASAGCGGNNTASTTTAAATTTTAATTVAETTTTTAAETTTTTEATTTEAETTAEEAPMEMTAPLFGRGVWEAYSGDVLDSYFVFYDETSGMIIGVERVETIHFTCEQNGTEIMFHLGSEENNTPAVFALGDATGTFAFGDDNVDYRFAALDTDVNEFLETHGFIV